MTYHIVLRAGPRSPLTRRLPAIYLIQYQLIAREIVKTFRWEKSNDVNNRNAFENCECIFLMDLRINFIIQICAVRLTVKTTDTLYGALGLEGWMICPRRDVSPQTKVLFISVTEIEHCHPKISYTRNRRLCYYKMTTKQICFL